MENKEIGSERYVTKTENGKLATTTGNSYGVYDITGAYVAATSYGSLFSDRDKRYYNSYSNYNPYPSTSTGHAGDAMAETTYNKSVSVSTTTNCNAYISNATNYYSWHGATNSYWFKVYDRTDSTAKSGNIDYYYYCLYRGNGGIFGYGSSMGNSTKIQETKYTSKSTSTTRAVVVSGEGI